MSDDDDDTSPAASAAVPKTGGGWSEEDRRNMFIAFAGGLAANLGTVILVGAAIGIVPDKNHAAEIRSTEVVAVLTPVALALGSILGLRQGPLGRLVPS